MYKYLILLTILGAGNTALFAQNIGIGFNSPAEKLHIDSGHVKIGRAVLTTGQSHLLKFGDGNFVTIGESDADDQMSLTASYFLFRSNGGFNGRVGINVPSGVPGAQLEVNGTVKITDGQQGAGKIFTSDAAGLASWQTPAAGSGAFKAVVAATQNFTSGANTTIIFTAEDYDDASSFFSTQYIAPATGLYHFDVMVMWDFTPVSSTTTCFMDINVGGVDVHEHILKVPAFASGSYPQNISCDLKLTAGQSVSVHLNQNSGILQPIKGNTGFLRNSWFSGRRVN
ncbi:MAG: hypothetical protein JNM68_15225 [Dinghuibacter sp.]|nr:hypothetical protein [Dinghuibacter sp.]